MEKLKLGLRRIVQLLISLFATIKLMELYFADIPALNFVSCTVLFSMCVFGLLLSYEDVNKIEKKQTGNYYKRYKA